MAEFREIMIEHNMLVDVPAPSLPEPHDFGVTRPVDRANPTNDPKIEAFLQAESDQLTGDSGAPGIPAYKLMSNDGWLVTPREISSALNTLFSTEDAPSDDAAWNTFVTFLSVAMVQDGFVVR